MSVLKVLSPLFSYISLVIGVALADNLDSFRFRFKTLLLFTVVLIGIYLVKCWHFGFEDYRPKVI